MRLIAGTELGRADVRTMLHLMMMLLPVLLVVLGPAVVDGHIDRLGRVRLLSMASCSATLHDDRVVSRTAAVDLHIATKLYADRDNLVARREEGGNRVCVNFRENG